MLNIVIPMAGRGQRFVSEGYELPKPLIKVHGRPMIQLVIENIRPSCKHRFIFLCRDEHLQNYELKQKLEHWAPGCAVIGVDQVTQGAACTVLLARNEIDDDCPLMIANCDQWVDVDIDVYLASMGSADGLIMTMWADDPKWSFVELSRGRAVRVVEKEVVSNHATVGIYNFKHGSDFVWAAERMIEQQLRVNNEFYVAPVYNQLIEAGRTVVCHDVGSVGNGMYGLGVPDDLHAFLALEVSKRAASGEA
jgi:dTDP-glucose pyrophosphorylase